MHVYFRLCVSFGGCLSVRLRFSSLFTSRGCVVGRSFIFDADAGTLALVDAPSCARFGTPNLGYLQPPFLEYIAPEQVRVRSL